MTRGIRLTTRPGSPSRILWSSSLATYGRSKRLRAGDSNGFPARDGRIKDRQARRLDGRRGEGDRPLGPGLCRRGLLLGMVDIASVLPLRHPGLNVADLGLDAALQC